MKNLREVFGCDWEIWDKSNEDRLTVSYSEFEKEWFNHVFLDIKRVGDKYFHLSIAKSVNQDSEDRIKGSHFYLAKTELMDILTFISENPRDIFGNGVDYKINKVSIV